MRLRTSMAIAALLAIPLFGCDVTVDVETDRADASTLEPLPEPGPDVDVWTRRSEITVFDETIEVDLRLALRSDGTYRMLVDVLEEGAERERESSEGTYRWDGARLLLRDEGGETATLTRRGDELELETDWPVDVVFAVTGLPDPTLRRAR